MRSSSVPDRLSDLDTVPRMLGWHHTAQVCRDALQSGRMLHLLGETTNVCNFNYTYCYTVLETLANAHDALHPHARVLPGELDLADRLKLIDAAAELGAVSYDIVGAGEPFVDAGCLTQLAHARACGLQPIVFTNGWQIGAGSRGEDLAHALNELRATVVVKHHGPADVHDALVRRKGAAEHRDRAIELLVRLGFNAQTPTRLGIDNIVCRPTLPHIPDCLRWCRQNNVHIVCSSYIPAGRTVAGDEQAVSFRELVRVLAECRRIDRDEFGLTHSLRMPFVGCGGTCTQTIGLYVNILGEVYGCVGKMASEYYGKITERSLGAMWGERLPPLRATYDGGCPPRRAFYAESGVSEKELKRLF